MSEDVIKYTAENKEEITLKSHNDDYNSSLLARVKYLNEFKKEHNVFGFLNKEDGELIGFSTNDKFSDIFMPEGWLYHEDYEGTVIRPNLETEKGQKDYDRFNDIAKLLTGTSGSGFAPNADEVGKNHKTLTTTHNTKGPEFSQN